MYSEYHSASSDEPEDVYHWRGRRLEDDDTYDVVPAKDVDTCDVSGVLLAVEKAIRMPNFRKVDLQEAFKLENWDTFQNV